ncbi:MAG TPA: phosphotransferase [Rhabdochlamydiaceae bacterium]|nr:phosphotransferase [Rhabdochlamydiaceae bacterium]
MLEKFLLSNQKIVGCLNKDYGLEVAALSFLPIGADMNASVYKAKAHNHSYFVKLKRGHHDDIGLILLALLHEAGIKEIIPPVKTVRGKLTQNVDDFTLIVYPFVEGQDAFSRHLTNDQWFTLGKVVRQIHEFEVPIAIQARIRRETYSTKWRKIVHSLLLDMGKNTNRDETAIKLLSFMKDHKTEIERLVHRADELAKKIQEESPKFVLCHSDIHGGNVLVDEKNHLYIVDWDEPIMAPKERDLMFIGGGVANVWNLPHEEEFFYKGYGKAEINREILAYYRHERIVEDIAIYGQTLLLSAIGGEDRLEMYKQFIAMFVPRGVVEIAFKTDA